MDMELTNVFTPVANLSGRGATRIDGIAILIQSAFCALPLLAIVVAISAFASPS